MKRNINLSEANLKTDLNRLTGEIVHEFHILCRKAGIYTVDHPMVREAVSRPFLYFQKLFGFKKYFTLVLTEGRLFANNIMQADSGFIDKLKESMQLLEITSLLIDESITPEELLAFVGRLVKRLPVSDPDHKMDNFLERHNIDSIRVNDQLTWKLFDTGLRYRGDVVEDFSIRRIVANHFSGEIDLAMSILSARYEDTEVQAREVGIDFHPQIVNYILPEKFAQLRPSELLQPADRFLADAGENSREAGEKLALLVRSFDFHPKRDMLIRQLKEKFEQRGIEVSLLPPTENNDKEMHLDVRQQMDDLRNVIFSDNFEQSLYPRFNDGLIRLMRTRRMGKAASLSESLVEYLASDNGRFRQHAIILLRDIIKAALSVGEFEFLDVMLRQLQSLFTRGKETFEFSEVVNQLLKALLTLRRYEPVAVFLNVLKSGRKLNEGVLQYDSVTIKKIFDELDNRELIGRLVRELQQRGTSGLKFIHDILTSIQSEEVALQLSDIVVHPERSVRQRCLKVLSELGRPSVTVFSEVLRDELNFTRPEGRQELPDKSWFLIRNAIFVLGNLGDCSACNALRHRLSDPDIRVRREIVSALEKIDGEEAIDLLMILAEDMNRSVREAAIIVLGLKKRPELARFFIDLVSRQKTVIARIIHAIAGTASEEGRDFLIDLLEVDERVKSLASGKASADDIRRMALKGLEIIGDDISQRKMKEYLSRNKNIFTGDLKLGATAKGILSKMASKK